ncbi:MAG TPA: thrombospondin type 3 repeat-containing protein, partial [Candidatus Polarisedimenticolia bacterium]|nr:thrombospondin type 3 repeat-containing protein [Candidatus Polarisedimenticolia bacterium]
APVIDAAGRGIAVFMPAADANTMLDGFMITGGRSSSGAGVFVTGSGIVMNNTIMLNTASTNSILSGIGGGLLVSGSTLVTGNTIVSNTALGGQGGGIAVSGGSPIITRNTISGNRALATSDGFYGYGGGVAVLAGAQAPSITSNLILQNSAEQGGGGVDIFLSSPTVAGNTIAGNRAGVAGRSVGNGGGIEVAATKGNSAIAAPFLLNNLLLDNIATRLGGGIDLFHARPIHRSNNLFGNAPNDFQGKTSPVGSQGNVSIDPNLPPGSFLPGPGFPHVEAGNDGVFCFDDFEDQTCPGPGGGLRVRAVIDPASSDFAGRSRLLDGDGDPNTPPRPDIGAYEFVLGVDLPGTAADDLDGDGVLDEADNCPAAANASQSDADGDLIGDACDNCKDAYNPAEADLDGGGTISLIETQLGPRQRDTDRDGFGDPCDDDMDGDGILEDGDSSGIKGDFPCVNKRTIDCDDNCPEGFNPDQRDQDKDGVGDGCDNCFARRNGVCGQPGKFCDRNGNGVEEPGEIANGNQADNDLVPDPNGMLIVVGDGVGDACDNCEDVPNGNCFLSVSACDIDGDGVQSNCEVNRGSQSDRNGDGQGDACETDLDKDGVLFTETNTCADADMPCTGGLKTGCDDNCPDVQNSGQVDGDGDLVGDNCDNCASLYNPDQTDTNADGQGNDCDTDDDGDGILDDGDASGVAGDNPCADEVKTLCDDNCPTNFNSNQDDADGDLVGDICDTDSDGDGILPDGDESGVLFDNICPPGVYDPNSPPACDDGCPFVYNPGQEDGDGDRFEDACDNCVLIPNSFQEDQDGDDLGDACDLVDPDGDSDPNMPSPMDNCPTLYNFDQADPDGDGIGTVCDNCVDVANVTQDETDGDGVGDACDEDDDGDTIRDTRDNCPLVGNPLQTDQDRDGLGDLCDPDDDGDGEIDAVDNCINLYNPGLPDADGDGIGNACDNCPLLATSFATDTDRDGIGDACDNCPSTGNTSQADDDGDGIGNSCDAPTVRGAVSGPDAVALAGPPRTFTFVLKNTRSTAVTVSYTISLMDPTGTITPVTTVSGAAIPASSTTSFTMALVFPVTGPAGKWRVVFEVVPTGETNLHRSLHPVKAS